MIEAVEIEAPKSEVKTEENVVDVSELSSFVVVLEPSPDTNGKESFKRLK